MTELPKHSIDTARAAAALIRARLHGDTEGVTAILAGADTTAVADCTALIAAHILRDWAPEGLDPAVLLDVLARALWIVEDGGHTHE